MNRRHVTRPAGRKLLDLLIVLLRTLANVAGTRPEKLAYKGAAKGLRSALVAVRAAERAVLESISLDDAVKERFNARVSRLLSDPKAWR